MSHSSRRRWLVLALVASLTTVVGVSGRAAESPSLEVQVDSGWLLGVDNGATYEWRGIPYAAPPVGELRWNKPALPEPWDGPLDASEFGAPCIQLASEDETTGSEDCLYLNVFAPSHPSDERLPVMVHLHGGSNTFGSPYQNASAFVQHDVIVVTVAYRLGVLGWLAHPDLPEGKSEYGLFDQIAALQWVQRNIAAFGGNPSNVTLFGESAGSFDAAALVASPLGEGLFARAALQTVWYGAFHDPESMSEVEEADAEFLTDMGCIGDDAIACLRHAPAEDLVIQWGPSDLSPVVGGEILPASPRDLIAESTVPLIVGSNREEATHWLGEYTFGGKPFPPPEYRQIAKDLVGEPWKELLRLYPRREYESLLAASVAMLSDGLYTCPIRALADTTDGPVWRYLYTHSYDNDEFLGALGAAHYFDEPIMWLDAQLLDGEYEFSPDEVKLSTTMTGYWTNFAKTGNPNGPRLVPWPEYSDTHQRVLQLDQPVKRLRFWHDAQCDFFDATPLTLEG